MAKRLRVTTHLPFFTTRIGLTVWWGSDGGWTGKQVAPWLWNRTWRVSGGGECNADEYRRLLMADDPGSSSGRTTAFEAENEGSTPSPGTAAAVEEAAENG